ncbi:SusC/RagA family TonB-linked outer membrane protein [Formosa sp. 3Alg 14/1]|uniref:SusC/RagA family TonB-linked outer membrane protein n=1 Tax=Formosa sp. 3Alg 14/1 TaxID=3382190 RepID=UPI0039BE0067
MYFVSKKSIKRLQFGIVLFLICCFQISNATPLNPINLNQIKVVLNIQDATIIDVFESIENQTSLNFIFPDEVRDIKNTISYSNKITNVSNVLNQLVVQMNIDYSISNNTVSVRIKKQNELEVPFLSRGLVTDENNMPLPGVDVLLKGTQTGTITDFDGKFELEINAVNDILVFTHIGYNKKEIKASSYIQVRMIENITGLNEILVIGYGKQKKRDVTGAVASVNEKDFSEIPVSNPLSAIKGKVAGVDVFNSSNEPGSSVNISIRGDNSIGANNNPLIVLDGIPLNTGFDDINPNDIASMEVLKDASATAIYGSRASNGVILITTKRGKSGETRTTFSTYYGITTPINSLDLMNGEEFAQLRREANRTVTANGNYPDDEDIFDNIALASIENGTDTDWQDFIYHPGNKENYQLSITGGKENTQFATSLNFYQESGVVDNADYQRGSIRINLDHKVNAFKVGVSSFLSRSKQNVVQNDLYDNVLRLSPLGVAYNDDGSIRYRPTNDESQRVNPLSDLANSLDERYVTHVFASIYGEYEFNDHLSYRLNIGPDLEIGNRGYFYGSETTNNQGGLSSAGISDSDTFSFTIENILNYSNTFGEKHQFTATGVQSFQTQTSKTNYSNVKNLPYDSQGYHNLATAGEVSSVGSNYKDWDLVSFTGRINYQYDDRYLFTATARADGSSRFSEGNKWGFFPSAAIAWRVSEEAFFDNVSKNVISDLKFRVSYGETGNTGIDPYQTFSVLEKKQYMFGDNGVIGFIPNSVSNPNLTWETTKQLNVGLDFQLWKQRLSGSVNYYVANTDDLLLPRSLPSSSGFSTVLENIGSTQNKGIEASLSINNIISTADFNWNIDLNFSKNTNKITELYGDGTDDIGNEWFLGNPINVFYDYNKLGIWQLDEAELASSYGFEPGQIKVQDVNEDGVINADDRVILGSSTPDWIGGLTNRLYYKGFGFSFVLYTRQNVKTYSEWYGNNNRLAGRYNNLDVDYWTPENPTNENPRPNVSQESVYLGSTLAYKDVSFVRVRNIVLSYALPSPILEKLKIREITFNVTADNPFTFTSYNGLDPEFESNGERASYPSIKTISMGLNLTF